MLAHTRHGGPAPRRVVLLHSLALDESVWDGLVAHLTDHAEVVTVDLPGHGRSRDRMPTTIESMADDVATTLDGIGFQPAVVAGLSLGGCVAQALAIRHPAAVSGLALIDTTCWYGPTAPDDWEQRASRAKQDGLASLAEFQLARWFAPGFLERNPSVGERLLKIFAANDVDAYVATCRAMGAVDLRDRLPAVDVPTCIAVGEHDPATPLPHAELTASLIDGATVHVVADCSHLSPVERPAEIATLIVSDLLA